MKSQTQALLPALDAILDQIKSGWLMGDPLLPLLPTQWQEAACPPNRKKGAKAGDESELRILALVGQYQSIVGRPPKHPLQARPVLPTLDYPSLEGKARALFVRCIKQQPGSTNDLLRLMAARGYSSHPLDWMPKSERDEVPELYQPWIAWLLSTNAEQLKDLSEDNWNNLSTPLRRARLRSLLRKDRAQARSVIMKCTPKLGASEREKIIGLLLPDAEMEDLECLRVFIKDRSARVREQVHAILNLLGASYELPDGADDSVQHEQFKELVQMLVLREGRLQAKRLPDKKKSRLSGGLWTTDPRELAKHFDLTLRQLAQTWHFEQNKMATNSLIRSFVHRGLIKEVMPLLCKLAKQADGRSDPNFLDHLSPEQHHKLIRLVVQRADVSFWEIASWSGDALGSLPFDMLHKSPAFKDLQFDLINSKKVGHEATHVDSLMLKLGLVVDHQGAAKFIEELKDLEVSSLHPALQNLHLNAALPPRREPPFSFA